MSETHNDQRPQNGDQRMNLVQRRTRLFEQNLSEENEKEGPAARVASKNPEERTSEPVVPRSRNAENLVKELQANQAKRPTGIGTVNSPSKSDHSNISTRPPQLRKTSPRSETGSVVATATRLFEAEEPGKVDAVRLKTKPSAPGPTIHSKVVTDDYAKVQKKIKKKLTPSASIPEKHEETERTKCQRPLSYPNTDHYDGVVVLSSASDGRNGVAIEPQRARTKPAPPKKPPRTFAHDDYLEAKAQRKALRKQLNAPYEDIKETPSYPDYEDVDDGRKTLQKPDMIVYEEVEFSDSPKQEKRAIDNPYGYEEVAPPPTTHVSPAKKHLEGVRQPNSKLPLPPRPPRPSKPESRLDSPVVKVNQHNERLTPQSFLGKRILSNPGYQEQHEVLPINSFANGSIKRYASDEYLYVESRPSTIPNSPVDNPIYQDPVDVMKPSAYKIVPRRGMVVFDADGYAEPMTSHRKVTRKHSDTVEMRNRPAKEGFGTLGRRSAVRAVPGMSSTCTYRPRPASLSEKLSRAYSVLRLKTEEVPDGTDLQPINEENDDDSDTEVDMDEHKKKLEYLCTVKLQSQKQNPALRKLLTVNTKRTGGGRKSTLFDFAIVVGLQEDLTTETCVPVPKILACYPPQGSKEEIAILGEFCFPDAFQWEQADHYTPENFSFVLTDGDGTRRYGHCRRFLLQSDGSRCPEVLCIISPFHSWKFYSELFGRLEERRKRGSIDNVCELLRAAHKTHFPDQAMEAYICNESKSDGIRDTIILERRDDPRLEGVSHDILFQYLKVNTLLKVFASILLERRIIFFSSKVSTLSDCIHAITSLLYPFTWQHPLVPVLPHPMLGVCASPTPFILGVLSNCQDDIDLASLEEVLIVDLDQKTLVRSQGDESRIIPKKLHKALTTALKDDTETRENRSLLITEAFLRLFVETVGHYTDYFSRQQDGKTIFQKESFIRAVSSKSIRMFLEWFTETQMFEVFMSEKLDHPDWGEELFEERIAEYREEMMKQTTFKQDMKGVGKKMQSFFMDFGGKLKAMFGRRNVFV